MLRTPRRRGAAIAVLALALGAMVVGFGAWDAPHEQSLDQRLADDDARHQPGDAAANEAGAGDAGADDGRSLAELVDTYWRGVYLYGVSLLAALWVAVRLRRTWQLDRDALAFVPADAATGDAPASGPAAHGARRTDTEDASDA